MPESILGASPMLLLEYWKPAVGYEGIYEVSNVGSICRLHRHQQFRAYGHLKPTINPVTGYLQMYLRKDGVPTTFTVHRIVADAHLGPRPIGDITINHINGCKTKNWVSNFEYLTRGDNLRHARANGIWPLGERHAFSIMKNEDVLNIRRLAQTIPQNEIAKQYGVSKQCINKIVLRRTWNHLP